MPKKYSISDYNENAALKLTLEMWLSIIYFLHPFMLIISTIQMGRGLKNSNVRLLKEAMYPDDFSLFIAIVAALPVFPVIFAAFKRKPEASDLVRKLWRNGKNFITAAAVMNIIILFVPFEHFSIYSFARVDWIQLAVAVGIIYFMHTSQRVKDTFADFPEDQ